MAVGSNCRRGRPAGLWSLGLVEVILYPHPTLRRASRPIKRVDAEFRSMVARMIDLMYESKGIGLAANQVDLPYRVFVMNPSGDPDDRAEELVMINPVLKNPKGMSEAEEGCLSIPGVYADVKRPERITINAYDLSGNEIQREVDGLFARIVQHETDHLDGQLFIDRLDPTALANIREELEGMEVEFKNRRSDGLIPDDATIVARLSQLEKLRT